MIGYEPRGVLEYPEAGLDHAVIAHGDGFNGLVDSYEQRTAELVQHFLQAESMDTPKRFFARLRGSVTHGQYFWTRIKGYSHHGAVPGRSPH